MAGYTYQSDSRSRARAATVASHVRRGAMLVVACVLVAPPAAARSAHVGPAGFVRPVPGPIIRGFDMQHGPYGPGHRGVDLAADVGTPVRAADSGTVTFAGRVVDASYVTVVAASGLETRYGPLHELRVVAGEEAVAGMVIGRVGVASGDSPGRSHLGFAVVRDGEYIDPAPFLRNRSRAHLVAIDDDAPMRPPDPVADADALGDLFAALERRGREVLAAAHAEDRPIDLDRLQDEIDLARSRLAGFTRAATQAAFESARVSGTADLDRLSDALGRLLIKADAAVASLRRAHASRLRAGQGRIAQSLDAAGLEEAGDALRRLYLTTRSVRRITAATSTPGHLVRALRAGAAYAHHRRGCTDRPRPTRFETPPARSVMAVEGFTSSYDGANIGNLGAMLAAIGYADDRIRRFSYADHDATGRALPYAARHTTIDIAANARRLGAQLRAAHRADPNARFDLVGHSLGGVVVAYFLAYVYEAADPAYPPIESAVTINSPLQGVPLAQLAVLLGETRTAGTLLDSSAWIEDRLQAAPDSRAIAQLAETSSFIRRLADAADFGGVDLTTIATTTDWLVPAANARHDAASTNVIVDAPEAGAWHEAHSSVRRDPSAHAAIVAAVEGEPHACVTPAAYFGLRTQAAAVHRAEQIAAYQLGLAALFFDGPRARNQS